MAFAKDLVASGLHEANAAAVGGSKVTAITAYATGGQTSATQLTGVINVIGTCATGGDSVKLPKGVQQGDEIWVRNNGAASCNVFPQSGGAINGGSADAAIAVANGKTAVFKSLGGADWLAVVTA